MRMSRLQAISLDNCKLAVQQFKIDGHYSSYIAMAVLILSLATVTVILNVVTIYVFWREKRTKTVTDILLVFLTITNIIGSLAAFAAESVYIACSEHRENMFDIFSNKVGGDILSGHWFDTLVTPILIGFNQHYSIFHPYCYNIRNHQTRP